MTITALNPGLNTRAAVFDVSGRVVSAFLALEFLDDVIFGTADRVIALLPEPAFSMLEPSPLLSSFCAKARKSASEVSSK